MLSDTGRLKTAGVDAVNVPDGPRAQSRMGALMTSVLIEQQVGIETVTHYACRDRNLLGMLSDLLGASAVGLRNLLIVTGDPPKMGPYPDATAVFDVDAIGLTNLVSNLNRGLDPGGNAIGQPTRFAIGVGVNPVAIDPDHELRRFEWKVDAGAEFAITQPVFDASQLEKFFDRIGGDAHSDHRRHLAARLGAERRVPGERSAGRVGARRDHRADAAGEREVEGARGRRGNRDRARDARPHPPARAGRSGVGAVRQGRTGARGVRGHALGRYAKATARCIFSAMRSILLIDHGSVRDEANHMLVCMANLLQHMVGDDVLVNFAHMELAEPTIAQGFAACVRDGATDIVAFPYMLSPGKHSTRDIPRMVAEAAAEFPERHLSRHRSIRHERAARRSRRRSVPASTS